MPKTLIIKNMLGLGDTFYTIPVIKRLIDFYADKRLILRTAWPQIFRNIFTHDQILLAPSHTKLRTQQKNEKNNLYLYDWDQNKNRCNIHINYVSDQIRGIPLYKGLCNSVNIDPTTYYLDYGMENEREPFVIIRPATVRKEWYAASRNPKAEYIQYCVDKFNEAGYMTIVVADIHEGQEDYDGLRPINATTCYERGELDTEELIDLMSKASGVIGGVGFIVPVCIALGTPAIVIHGGAGGWNHPDLINAPGKGKINHVLPDNYCRCKNHRHNCNKEIAIEKIDKAIEQLMGVK